MESQDQGQGIIHTYITVDDHLLHHCLPSDVNTKSMFQKDHIGLYIGETEDNSIMA
jgi:hypothetical protein